MMATTMPGVYRIRNRVTGDFYIGSSANIRRRWGQHRRHLNRGGYGCRHLQAAWDKYGEASFEFEVLEFCPNPLEREQAYIDQLRPAYNVLPCATSALGVKRSPETLTRMSAAQSGKRHSEATRAKIGAAQIGKTLSPEHRRRVADGVRAAMRSDELRQRIAAGVRGITRSPETRRRMSDGMRLVRAKKRLMLGLHGIEVEEL